jgi:O-antigen ligase
MTQPLVLGQFAGALVPLCAALAINEKAGWRYASMIAVFGCMYCVFVSTSRSGLLVFIVANLFFVLLMTLNWFKYRWLILTLSLAIASVVSLYAFYLGDALTQVVGGTADNLSSARIREIMVSDALTRASESPWMGHGDGTAQFLAGVTGPTGMATIDSLYLSILIHGGYVGLVLWVAFMSALIMMAVRNALEGANAYVRAINSAIAAFLVGMGVGFSVLSIEDNVALVFLFAGMVIADRLGTRSSPGRLGGAVF